MGNDNREIAIRLSGVKKRYKLGQIGGGTLTEDLQSWWARVRGKEDPNLPIGMDQRLVGKTFMALNGVDLTVYKGEALGIIGGNGAGKSTMLKLLCRVTAPTEGDIDIYGRITSMLEVGTGFNGEMTGRENVYMNGAILGMTKAEIDAKMEDIIDFSEVREFIDTPTKRYSSGMFVKLAFSVAAHLDSEIMIMDEVLAVGDVQFQKKCLDRMRAAAKQEGRTVLYVSHNMNTIRQLCDRCIVMDKGKIIFEGGVEEAIGVYYGKEDTLQLHYDCEHTTREPIGDDEMHIHYVEIMDRESPILYEGEGLKLKVAFSSQREFPRIAFRTIFFTPSGIPVGMAASAPELKVGKGENEAVFRLPLPQLAEGEYSGRIVLYEVNEYGSEIVHDVVNAAFTIRKEFRSSVNDTSKRWGQQYWGSIVFPTIEILGTDSQ
ncbi:MAG: ABC transporter ATP-binding protein [Faecousia sp.]